VRRIRRHLTRIAGPLAAALVAFLGTGTPAALADGDPFSDTLAGADYVALPMTKAAPPAAEQALRVAVYRADRAGPQRIEVGVVGSPIDLGSAEALYGQPQVYAKFLAAELRASFTGTVLIVMPQGFGVVPGVGITKAAAEQVVMQAAPPASTRENDLLAAATGAVDGFAAAFKAGTGATGKPPFGPNPPTLAQTQPIDGGQSQAPPAASSPSAQPAAAHAAAPHKAHPGGSAGTPAWELAALAAGGLVVVAGCIVAVNRRRRRRE
jgi:hypothetical protein